MKKLFLFAFSLSLTFSLHAQWADNGSNLTTGDNVGIGISYPTSSLHVKKDVAGDIGPILKLENHQYANSSGAGSRIMFFGHSELRNISIDGIMRNNGKPNRLDFNFEENGVVRNTMTVKFNGSVGIGTIETGSHKLAVEGSIGAREIKVEASGWSDFVFEEDYNLRTLEEVESYISENKHLPDVPSEAEVTINGIYLGEMNARLLQKIEELTLYLIEQNRELKNLKEENKALTKRLEKVESRP